MQNTISYLNTKIWYRLLKTLYITLFLIITGFITFFIYTTKIIPSTLELDHAKTKIVCQIGNKRTFTIDQVFDGLDRYFYSRGYYENGNLRKVIQKKCEIDANSLSSFSITRGEMKKNGIIPFVWSNGTEQIPTNSYVPNLPLGFEIKEEYNYIGFIIPIIIDASVALILILLVFELVRRVFYYIILGTIRPKK